MVAYAEKQMPKIMTDESVLCLAGSANIIIGNTSRGKQMGATEKRVLEVLQLLIFDVEFGKSWGLLVS